MESKTFAFLESRPDKTGFPQPSEVVQAALAEIQPDGTVTDYDEETESSFLIKPNEPIPLDRLPPDNYARELYRLSKTITGVVSNTGHFDSEPQSVEGLVKGLAKCLTAYRHDPAFIEYATSLVQVSEDGLLYHPTLPEGSPWAWVPRLREELVAQSRSDT